MGFSAIRVYNFRNLENSEIYFPSSKIFFIGNNGQGKTNWMEAIYLLCYGSSFRIRKESIMINREQEDAMVKGILVSLPEYERTVSVHLKRKGIKEIKIDSKNIKDRKELLQNIPAVIFSHNDLYFITGSPASKRRFFNQTLCMFDIGFINLLRKYKKVVIHRNKMLKQNHLDLLDIYNMKMVEYGLEIQKKRKEIIKLYNNTFCDLFNKISGIKGYMEIRYKPVWGDYDSKTRILDILKKNLIKDIRFRTSTLGPHRDNFNYFLEGRDFAQIASTGQVRLISIILRVAQAQFFFEVTGKKPILLVDDVLLEIDQKKRETIINYLPPYEQAFFTFLPDEDFRFYESNDTVKYHVLNGKVRPWKEQEIY